MPTLHWIGKEKVINHHLDVPYRVLEHQYTFNSPMAEALEAEGESGNKIIRGDNLEALKSLLPEYEGKIKCIYIDPPYNTGNEGWVYNDNVNDPKLKRWLGQVVGKEAEDLTRHDKWLCMMYPRLKLLHKLLAEDGAIFISINEDEQASLKLLLDEIFGSANYLTMFTIKLRHEERILKGDKEFHEVTEQLYLYRKSNKFKPHKKQYDNTSIDEYIYEVNIMDDNPKTFLMDGKTVTSYNPNQFKIVKKGPNENCLKKINIRGTLKEGNSSGRFYMKHFHPLVTEYYGYLFSVPDMGDDGTGNRFFLLPKDEKKSNGDYFQGIPQKRSDIKEVPYPNYFDFTDDFNRVGYEGGVDFRFGKKPLEFLKRVFEIAGLQNIPDALVLDSFGGSGSTGHAVLQFNKDYVGNRKFILIEMQEYAETTTAARLKNAINGHGDKEGTGGSFDYYELGPALFNEDNEINELVGVEKLRQYMYYTETKSVLTAPSPSERSGEESYLLNKHNDTAYYFYYEQDMVTTLNHDFLSTIKTKAEQYVIYADNCLLTKEFMTKHHIIFKKIPRDITKF
jgi:adenine-specific DNA-methyltransferase